MVIEMKNLKTQRNIIAASICNPESVNWEHSIEPNTWRQVLVNITYFNLSRCSPDRNYSRAVVYSDPKRFSATDLYLVLIEGEVPVFYGFESNLDIPIIFKTDDIDSLKKHKKYLKLIYRGFLALLNEDEVYDQMVQYMVDCDHTRPVDIDDDISDESVKIILQALKHFTDFIKSNDSTKFIEKPIIY